MDRFTILLLAAVIGATFAGAEAGTIVVLMVVALAWIIVWLYVDKEDRLRAGKDGEA